MKEKISRIIVLILILILIYKIVEISAAYKTALQANIDANIEPWKILVNDVDITKKETKTFDLEGFVEKSDYVAEGKIAPGSTFKIPLKIDASETKNIDVRYDIKIENIEQIYPNIQIKEIIEENDNCNIIRTGKDTYTGLILNKNEKTHNLLINLIWENNEENNELDTEIGINLEERQKISVPITVYVSQYGNEELKEYIKE